ncbi:MAG: LysM peptidoglycan-binding domain-containing protein [Lachnospiraceae bacterium]|nr:LysM peptidoglycan-binding domain-containing protein [Lachnospiraceae bacterium]
MYRMYIGGVLFPVTPGKISYKVNGSNETINLINGGEANIIKSPGLKDISIDELLLPAFQDYPFATYKKKFHSAWYYIDKLEIWKKRKKPVKFKITRTKPNEKFVFRKTDFDVTIEDYEIIEDAEKYGMDICVKIYMKQYRFWGAKILKPGNSNNKNKNAAYIKKARNAKDPAGSYVVKKGDCLMYIARKQLGDGSRWKEIYSLNKKVIEAEAKKRGRKSSSNGHWIYPGTKLKLPG